MARIHSRMALLLILSSISSTVFSLSVPSQLSNRQASCPIAGNIACGQGLPSDFCCPSTEKCIALVPTSGSNTTGLCCPVGSDCSAIGTIDCDIQQQNVTAFPSTPLMTTALNLKLTVCQIGCCPFGYKCTGTGCMLIDQNVAGSSSISGSTSVPTSFVPITTPTSTSAPAPADSTTSTAPAAAPASNPFPATAVLAGFFPGLLAGVLGTILVVCALGARRRSKEPASSFSPSTGHPGISDPIIDPGSSMRSDFIRAGSSTVPSTPTPMGRVKSLFRKNTTAKDDDGDDIPLASTPPSLPMAQTTRGLKSQSGRYPVMPRMPTKESGVNGLGLRNATMPSPGVQNIVARNPSINSAISAYSSSAENRRQTRETSMNINIFADPSDTNVSSVKSDIKGKGKERADDDGYSVDHGHLELPDRRHRESHQTTFTDMMDRADLAGLRKGEPFVQGGGTPTKWGTGPARPDRR